MKNYHYTDGIEHIALQGGMIRVDLFQYEQDGDAEHAIRHEVTDRLLMPPLAFAQACNAMNQMLATLQARGIITRHDKETASSPESPPAPPAIPEHPLSPNFS